MMNLMLDDETERYLIEILAVEKIPSDRLIKKILRDRWLTHQPKKTLLERRGGHPEHLLGKSGKNESEIDEETGWDVFLSLGKDAPKGKLQDASVDRDRYLYAKELGNS
jgi:hypothetical protein